MTSKFKIFKSFIVIPITFWLISAFYLVQFYNWEQARLSNLIFPSLKEGYSIVNAKKVTNFGSDENFKEKDLAISIKPGDQYTGKLAVKNHENPYMFEVLTETGFGKVIGSGEKNQKIEVQPAVQFKPKNIFLNRGEMAFIEYTISVPEDFPLGKYEGIFQFYPPEKFKNSDKPKGSVVFLLMAGIRVNLEVSENPKNYKYVDSVSDPVQVAKSNVINRFRIILIVFFILLGIKFTLHARSYSN